MNHVQHSSLPFSSAQIAARIDHTLLKADAQPEQIKHLCDEAREHGFFSVCVQPVYVPLAVKCLQGTHVKVITVVGFPLGATLASAKAFEAKESVKAGAQEIDMVLAIGLLKAGDHAAVQRDIQTVVEAVTPIPVKVILETAILTDAEKRIACQLAEAAGAAWVKTSTGFSTGGATLADVQLMRAIVGPSVQVKASGGIKTRADAIRMLEAGANRLGTSSGVSIVTTTDTTSADSNTGY